MLKKITITFLIFIFSINSVFAYNITKKDKLILNKIYKIIDKKFSSEKKSRKLYFAVEKIKPKYLVNKNNRKYNKKIRIYYLLIEIEKYLDKKYNFSNKNHKILNYNFGGSNLIQPEKIKKVKLEEQDADALEFAKKEKIKKNKRTKKIKKILKKNIFKEIKRDNKKILKTTRKNGVLIKYVKLKKNKYIPKHIPKNTKSKVQKNFLVKKIINNRKYKNIILVNYYGKIKIFQISGLYDYSCDSEKLNGYLKNNLENKRVRLENIKKINQNNLMGEFIVNGKSLSKKIIDSGFCKLKK